jgi:excisionase family DNA binding protein
MRGDGMSPGRRPVTADLLAALEALVDERVAAVLANRELPENRESPWLTLAQSAERLHVSRRTVSRLVARGRIRTCAVGRRVLVHSDDLDAAVRDE